MTAFGKEYHEFLNTLQPTSRLRLAPTPSGFLHIGNAYNFILNWLAARLHPGTKILLRIDDLDADRKRPEYVQDIFDTLHWLGLDWDEGPRTPDDFEQNWSQHLRLPLYAELLEKLRATDQVFACAKSRRELAPFAGHYPIEFRAQNLSLDASNVAWRIKTRRPNPILLPEDFVVRRRDGIPAYQIASLADDLHFGISHIIRGEDLSESTAAQQFLATSLGLEQFTRIKFLHHPILQDAAGTKLSKSAGATAIKTIREKQSAAFLYQSFSEWLGLGFESIRSANDILKIISDSK